jgi:hypothetical protein
MLQEFELAAGLREFNPDSLVPMRNGVGDLTAFGEFETHEMALQHRHDVTTSFVRRAARNCSSSPRGLARFGSIASSGTSRTSPRARRPALSRIALSSGFLDYRSNLEALEKLVHLLQGYTPGCRILMSVSPVALNATFLPRDVLISNTYSKACLRAVVEELYWRFDCIDYSPATKWDIVGTEPCMGTRLPSRQGRVRLEDHAPVRFELYEVIRA